MPYYCLMNAMLFSENVRKYLIHTIAMPILKSASSCKKWRNTEASFYLPPTLRKILMKPLCDAFASFLNSHFPTRAVEKKYGVAISHLKRLWLRKYVLQIWQKNLVCLAAILKTL